MSRHEVEALNRHLLQQQLSPSNGEEERRLGPAGVGGNWTVWVANEGVEATGSFSSWAPCSNSPEPAYFSSFTHIPTLSFAFLS